MTIRVGKEDLARLQAACQPPKLCSAQDMADRDALQKVFEDAEAIQPFTGIERTAAEIAAGGAILRGLGYASGLLLDEFGAFGSTATDYSAIDAADKLATEGAADVIPTPGNMTVYTSTAADGTTQYVGITSNVEARSAAHLSQKGIEIDPIPGLQGISSIDARAVEQVLIEYNGLGKNGGSLLNKINSISATNPVYASSLERGASLLKSAGYPGFK
jgi:filamentous hemagglutinin